VGGAALADLDHDGTPEIVVGATVLNNDGTTRWEATRANDSPLSLVTDLDLDGIPEVVAGRSAYRADGSLYWDAPATLFEYTAVGNFDADPFPEVVLASGGQVYLLSR
jgi:hypothetical protein